MGGGWASVRGWPPRFGREASAVEKVGWFVPNRLEDTLSPRRGTYIAAAPNSPRPSTTPSSQTDTTGGSIAPWPCPFRLRHLPPPQTTRAPRQTLRLDEHDVPSRLVVAFAKQRLGTSPTSARQSKSNSPSLRRSGPKRGT